MDKSKTHNQSMHFQQEGNFEDPDLLDYFQSLNYEIRLRKKRNHFVLAVMELGIVEKSEDLTMAYEKIQVAKETHFRSMIEDGYRDLIVKPFDYNNGVSPPSFTERNSLKYFLAKTAIVSIIITLLSFGLISQINTTLNNNVNNLKSIETKIKDIGNWPEERVNRYKLRVRNISRKIKPIAEEIKILWEPAKSVDDVK